MGLLKHALLPYFVLFHLLTVVCMLPVYRRDFMSVAYKVPAEQELSAVTHHLLDAVAGFHAAVAFGCVRGILSDDFRGTMIAMEVILWFFDWAGSFYSEETDSTVMAVNLLIAVFGAGSASFPFRSEPPG